MKGRGFIHIMKQIKKSEFEKYDPLTKSQHPDYVLSGLLKLILKIGTQKFLNGAGYNRDRDSFVSILFTYAIRKWSKREWFIQQISDPPDFYVISPTNRATKDKPIDCMGVEIIEIKAESTDEAIVTVLQSKLKNYAPGSGTALLVFLNNKNAIRVGSQLSTWAVRNREKFNNFSELYFLYLESFSSTTTWAYRVINIFKVWEQKCVLSEEFKKGILFPHDLIDKYHFRIIE